MQPYEREEMCAFRFLLKLVSFSFFVRRYICILIWDRTSHELLRFENLNIARTVYGSPLSVFHCSIWFHRVSYFC